GLADPRGCAYREIELQIGSVWGFDEPVRTHGWVLPSRDGGRDGDQTWAIAWDGLVYPARAAGGAPGRGAGVAEITAALQPAARAAAKHGGERIVRMNERDAYAVSYATPTLTKVALVLQIGEPELASQLWSVLQLDDELAKGVDPYLRL